jgi:RNA polymerase sigma factor (sigma-70 family)
MTGPERLATFARAFSFMQNTELIPHLFRTEYRKIVSVLCKRFGFDGMETAEDIASDTFATAAQVWGLNGAPENPVAWLYTVAKNKARNYISHNQLFKNKIASELRRSVPENEETEIDLSEGNISDSQLQMMFAICHPSISTEAQIGLSLRILCGFGIDEIASAFLTSKETVNKRLFRAREKLRNEKVGIDLPSENEIGARLDTVLTTLYLLFSEGYYSESQDEVLREDLCFEAMRLTQLLIENEKTHVKNADALLALMCFHASRFKARKSERGEIILYNDQDEAAWDQELISKGAYFLQQASQGDAISKYHLEAGIAYWHTQKADTKEKWENILQLYNLLLQLEYSPIAALNRTYALSKANGTEQAIVEAEKLNLSGSPYYFTLLGELYKDSNKDKARINFEKALALARTSADKKTILDKIKNLSD